MSTKYLPSYILCISMCISQISFAEHEIAITIDDLPFVGTGSASPGNLQRAQDRFMKIVEILTTNNVPATGFVIAGAIAHGQWQLLENFRNAGLSIGNHTYSHANLNRLSAEEYINEISRAENVLATIMTEPKYFRYPYLAEGTGDKKQQVYNFLIDNHYTIAPVTIDSKDYNFNNRLYRINWRLREKLVGPIKQQYLAYIWKETLRAEKKSLGTDSKQILLIHANLLNSFCLGDIIEMYKSHGYRFISLTEALKNTTDTTTTDTMQSAKNTTQQSFWLNDIKDEINWD